MNTPTDKPDDPAHNSLKSPENHGITNMAPQSTTAIKHSNTPVDLTPVFSDMGETEQEQRRLALRSMLAATEARQQNGKRSRNPTLTAGLHVGVKGGEHFGANGVILDADYIHSRVLIDIGNGRPAIWVSFRWVTAINSIAHNNDQSNGKS